MTKNLVLEMSQLPYMGSLDAKSSSFLVEQVPIVIECCAKAQKEIEALESRGINSYNDKLMHLIEQERLNLFVKRLIELKDNLTFFVFIDELKHFK